MKLIKNYIVLCLAVALFYGCDKGFVEVNTDPYAVSEIDPALMFAGSQRSHVGNWTGEHTIVQQFVTPYNQGATLGFNFNEDIDGVNNRKWNDSYPGPIRNLTQAQQLIGEDATRINLSSMIRIWKAQVFMGLVDAYGNVPYFEAGKAASEGVFYPKYDEGSVIFDDLYKELKEAIAALNPSGDYVSSDLFYGANSENPSGSAAVQVEKWRKLGNSLLLRLGMRYTKLDPAKAQSIVSEAFAGGVMTSNDDNAYVKYDGTLFAYGDNDVLRDFSHFNYAAEPFVDQLKSTNDPRGKYIVATFADPASVANDPNPDTVLVNQFGAPIGVTNDQIVAPDGPYRGARVGGLNYSQMNIYSVASPAAPIFWVTYAQTSLLLAEAAQRGWIDGSAQAFYEDGIRADMMIYELYPLASPIPESAINAYLGHPEVAFDPANALELINTQYWVVNIRNGTEAFANFRRSGYPVLSPNTYNNNLQGGFARRLAYPDEEASANADNYAAAAAAMGGDNLTSRVFWDVP